MVERRIGRRLQPIATRMRRLWFSTLLAVIWMLVAALGLAIAIVAERAQRSPVLTPVVLATIAIVALVLTYVYCGRRTRDYRRLARHVEKYYPDLNARLMTAVEQQPVDESGMYSFLQETVIREALYHDYRHPWYRAVPSNQLVLAYVACFVALLLVCTASWKLSVAARPFAGGSARAGVQVYSPGDKVLYQVEPGDVEVERGTSLLVTVRFETAPPPEVILVASDPSGEQQLKMTRSLDDPLFGIRLDRIDEPLTYRIELDRHQSREFRVGVFEFPRLERVDAELIFPEYTGLEARQLADVRRITAVEGTELRLTCYMNKLLAEATLASSDDQRLSLQSTSSEPLAYGTSLRMERSNRWQIHLRDAQGRTHKQPPAELNIQVTPNQPPSLKWVAPARDMRVSALEEVLLAGTVFDDFGITRYGLSFRHATSENVDIVLGENRAGGERYPVHNVLELESLNAEPDQLVSYYLWAEDIGPDGQRRRVYSDMYFAEVRPFEEIFRQGQPQSENAQQQQQQRAGGAGQQAEQLAELQKQIIQGTWNLIRRESSPTLSAEYATDADVLTESQQSAIEQLEAMAGQVQDARSLLHLDSARQAMSDALDHLTKAGEQKQIGELREALPLEQLAYQSLLSLSAREHEVVRSQQSSSSSSGGGSSSRAQQELQQLELSDDPNRYETERTAQSEDPMQRELRQGLNRLRELARRQGDLNERLKELQSALEQADTEAERRELENQLKRLREEQEEILRDTDELQQRLDQPQNQERLAEQREQLANTRENVRRSSEALQEGQVSQAITSGTRAERELKDLQEEFRRQTSNQFEEEMKEMRQEARQLSENQQQIGNQLNELIDQEARSLRPSEQRKDLEQSLTDQQRRVDQLLEAIRDTVQQAEQDEPLLSRKLYDTYRQTQQDNPQQSLEQANQWIEEGFPDQAQQPAQIARAGIERLASGVEDAAEGILGDESEALRRARDELNKLTEQLAEEMDRAGGSQREAEQQGRQGQQGQEGAEQQSGEQQSGQQQSGEQQSGQQQAGQQPSGQQQSGEQGGARTGLSGPQSGPPQDWLDQMVDLVDRADQNAAPLTGDDYRQWSDRLRDVEEMLDDPDLRAEAARIRDRAREMRIEWKRHSKEPAWDLVRGQIQQPLIELRDRIAEELRRRAGERELAPVDRDPVPAEFEEHVRRYYEKLGSGRP